MKGHKHDGEVRVIMSNVTFNNFNMDWRILVFYTEPEARDTIY
jgi:hypothetical protein